MTTPTTKAKRPARTSDSKTRSAEERQTIAEMAREHPVAFIAGGVALGLVVGALLPKKAGGALFRRALTLAATASELGLVASRQAREGAGKAAHEAKERLEKDSAVVREKAGKLAVAARGAGNRIASQATGLASRLKH